ncbi:carboxymuconolactone decarboxylase family protein [Brucella tritici]|uniref:carboxymuconolactone decarboxylase family protein n=1 Tax=Brucella tritici TaxID=94626 RepID=UPI002E255096|nr:carboxymuconolactone decarboxylase family protein [Brucella tritici]
MTSASRALTSCAASTHRGSAPKTGNLEPKVHELIALAVAVTTRCDGCIAVHSKKAVELGANHGRSFQDIPCVFNHNSLLQ